MNILHARTDPSLLRRLREMLGGSARADIAVGYFFMSGFEAIADDLARLEGIRILVGRVDRQVLEELAAGVQQAEALRTRISSDETIRRSQRGQVAAEAVSQIGTGVSTLPQTDGSEKAVGKLAGLIESGKVQFRTYPRSRLHAKAYLCWYDNHPEPGAAVVGSSNLTLAGFEGNTELNVRVTGDAEMAEINTFAPVGPLPTYLPSSSCDQPSCRRKLLTLSGVHTEGAIALSPPEHG